MTITSSSDLTIRGCLDTGKGTLVVKVEDGSTGGSDGEYSVVKTNVSVADDCVRVGRVELDGINNKRSCEKLDSKVSRYCHLEFLQTVSTIANRRCCSHPPTVFVFQPFFPTPLASFLHFQSKVILHSRIRANFTLFLLFSGISLLISYLLSPAIDL